MAINRSIDGENLETYSLIYLKYSTKDSNELEKDLRQVINYCLIYDDEEQCLQYIKSRSKSDRLIVLIDDKCPPELVQLPQITKIYVYTNDSLPSMEQTKKIKIIGGTWTELIEHLQTDQKQRNLSNIDQILPTTVFWSSMKTEEKFFFIANSNLQFVQFQMLINNLLQLGPLSIQEKNDFVQRCQQQYENNLQELNSIEEFKKHYSAGRCFEWLKQSTFLSRLLEKSLRTVHIEMLIYLRFFIADLIQTLDKVKMPSSLRFFRAQTMSKKDLEILNKSIGEFVCIHQFFWANVDRDRTRSLLVDCNDDVEKVLFQIDIDHRWKTNKRFRFDNDETLLFSVGSIFRLVYIDRDADGIWNLQLDFCSENDHQLREIFQLINDQSNASEVDLLSFGFLLEEINRFDEAEKFFQRRLQQLPKDHEAIPRCYHALGELMHKQNQFDQSLKYFKKSLEIEKKTNDTAMTHHSIGLVYSKKADFSHALESFRKALEIWKKSVGDEHLHVALCYNNMGIILQEQKKYTEALEFYQKAWAIRQKNLSLDSSLLAQSHFCLGNVHYFLRHLDLALEHFQWALNIWKKALIPRPLEMASIIRNLAFVYYRKGDLQQTISLMKQSAIIYRHCASSTHPELMQIEESLRRLTRQTVDA